MNDIPTLVTTLEDLLVQEFRACQSIHHLTKDERQALTKYDIPSLAILVEQKEVMLDELVQIEDRRRMIVQNLGEVFGLYSSSPSLVEISNQLSPDVGGRINRLREGITALAEEIKVITSGNETIVVSALDRVDSLQTFLLDSFRPSLFYERPGTQKQKLPDAAWDIDQRI